MEGNTEHRTAAYLGLREDSSTGLTSQKADCGGFERDLLSDVYNYYTAPILVFVNETNDIY
ncbi:MAG: palindromic element RPE1 domain-containing protein [Holosporales bacterium]|nr:palindromic element RPE1 domain-containing protein [Holosporales bacterium]